MSLYFHKSHNVSVLLYHIVCPVKYRRVVFGQKVDQELKLVCLELAKRYDIHFLEIGTDKNHVHFMVQSVPMYSPTKIVKMIKSITAREILSRIPEVRKELWGGAFWFDGYYISTIGRYGTEDTVRTYVKKQGMDKDYVMIHKDQLKLNF